MSFEERLLASAKEATGDDAIIDVAIFHPRGFSAATGVGAGIGSAAGGDSDVGSAVGAAVGGVAGMTVSGAGRDLPLKTCVAITREKVYLMEGEGMTDFAADVKAPFAEIDRTHLGVEVHQRAMNRVVVLHDETNDEIYSFEAPRFGPYHAKAAVRLLVMSEEHFDEEPAIER